MGDEIYEPQNVPYADQLPQTIHLTDGIRARKTDSAYVLERLKSDNTWEAFSTGGGGGNVVLPTTDPHVVNALWLDGGIITVSSG